MLQRMELLPGIRLHGFRDERFKQGGLSIQFIRPMKKEEAAMNALIPAVLLRGTEDYPDLRAITLHLDDLYGAAVSTLVRRVGDYQTTGLYCSFMEDKYALDGDEILAPMVAFLGQLLFHPVKENGGFSRRFVEGEKKNLIATIQAEKNDKRAYASAQLLKILCKEDSFGLPRLGEAEDVRKITPENLYAHYSKVLEESPVEVFYVGSMELSAVAQLLKKELGGLSRKVCALPAQTALVCREDAHITEEMDVAQAKLCMGFTTPITHRDGRFAAMQVMNTLFGGGMTSKLFLNVREKLSLCYSVGSGYYGTKGILTVAAGIDEDKEDVTRREIFAQLDACRKGEITPEELGAAKEAMLSALRTAHDSPGAIEGYYARAAITGQTMDLQEYARQIQGVTVQDVAEAAGSLCYRASFFLKGAKR